MASKPTDQPPADDQADATDHGVSAQEPAEGADDTPGERPGSPEG